jgi:hypothetical protein
LPPNLGAGYVHDRVLVRLPNPHVREQKLHCDHSVNIPWTNNITCESLARFR